jgi:hypothetical protein
MLRFILIFCFALAVSGSALYMTKLSVDGRHDRLSALQAEITDAKNRAIILEAEWAYLSRPDRLLGLSSSLLSMRPITPNRVLPLESIPLRVPEEENERGDDAQ